MKEVERDLVAGRFRLESIVGSGGMGTVWSAQDLLKGERVAVKLLHAPQEVERRRLFREADALRGVEHPAVVAYVAHGEHGGRGWLAMEWLEGIDLAQRLAKAPLSLSELRSLAKGVAEALAILHEHGLVHRDIKPANVFLLGEDPSRIKIVDFSLAKSPRLENITAHGQVIGTVAYMVLVIVEDLPPRTPPRELRWMRKWRRGRAMLRFQVRVRRSSHLCKSYGAPAGGSPRSG